MHAMFEKDGQVGKKIKKGADLNGTYLSRNSRHCEGRITERMCIFWLIEKAKKGTDLFSRK